MRDRDVFIQELVAASEHNPNIALVVGDLGYHVVEPFSDRFPERFFNAGVAEQNMMGLAAGLASEGMHTFVYSIANFPTFRCAEQIRNDVAYHNLPVTIVAGGCGLAYGSLGYSHHAVQDYALIRAMPNMLIAAPGDLMEVHASVRYLIKNPQPSYLRLGNFAGPNVHSEIPTVMPGGWAQVHNTGSEVAYLTTGATLQGVMALPNIQSGVAGYSVYSVALWSMAVKKLQGPQCILFSKVITVEDHLVDGGFGSWLLESVALFDPGLLPRIEVKSLDAKVCGMVGKQAVLNAQGGLFFGH